ncbi:hypothetical protein [Streptomyces sp. ME19-01-6]|nr:hypothetical protein [Streptomyces sp. ME19-01-6]MDX3225159.1 hypothetical protein [Streptomyces sp. ME19-01-6]
MIPINRTRDNRLLDHLERGDLVEFDWIAAYASWRPPGRTR